MSLIVEDGTGLAGAESYGSVAESNAYHTPRGNEAAWSDLDTDVKERHLRNATTFMRVYRSSWAGARVHSAQRLDWPRQGVVVDNFNVLSTIVPTDVKEACFELALRDVAGALLPDLDAGSNQVKREKVGPLETEYFQANVEARDRFPAVNAILARYFGTVSSTGSIKLRRG